MKEKKQPLAKLLNLVYNDQTCTQFSRDSTLIISTILRVINEKQHTVCGSLWGAQPGDNRFHVWLKT